MYIRNPLQYKGHCAVKENCEVLSLYDKNHREVDQSWGLLSFPLTFLELQIGLPVSFMHPLPSKGLSGKLSIWLLN